MSVAEWEEFTCDYCGAEGGRVLDPSWTRIKDADEFGDLIVCPECVAEGNGA